MTDAADTLTLETTKGPVVIKLRPDLAPKHVARIKKLVSEGFYDGIVFHRVIEGFMAQTGCPRGTGTGGSNYPNLEAGVQRRAACARNLLHGARLASRHRQFAVLHLLRPTRRFLDRQYTVWGEVISGMENVDKIKRGEPVQDPDKIVKATLGASSSSLSPRAGRGL